MILETYTIVHTLLSLIAILTGVIVVGGMLAGRRCDGWTKWFLITTVLTSVTGFFFPFHGFTPAIGVGVISLIVLAIAILARYSRQLAGHWRGVYVVTAVIALYLNVLVLVAQLFQKIPALHTLAPMQTEQPFKLAQLVVLAVFVLLAILATIKFHPEPVRLTRSVTLIAGGLIVASAGLSSGIAADTHAKITLVCQHALPNCAGQMQ
jgi:hypothetical protein